ncbi:DUF6507 family protein [Paenarthrobacter sp. NPDC056912]|uniref:DUF6507 family protein n=1 Tax=Paenarthrobacter sp. NPDC056912 TaxID=3345965 RepID=UPI003670F582
MVVWNIDVGTARAVISLTAGSVAGLDIPLSTMQAAVEGIATAVPSGQVQQALGALVENGLVRASTDVIERSSTVLSGTSEAVTFYVSGDMSMASAAASSAATVYLQGRVGGPR